jgi:hypothetical protein
MSALRQSGSRSRASGMARFNPLQVWFRTVGDLMSGGWSPADVLGIMPGGMIPSTSTD